MNGNELRKIVLAGAALAGVTVAAVACGGGERGGVAGSVEVDGSSTVYPITEAVAEEFMLANEGDVRVTVGISGTGGGFKRFCAGETDISNASREIKESEREACEGAGVEFIELPIAYDGLSVVVNPANDWAVCMTVAELRAVWEPGSGVRLWSDVREGWPEETIKLYGPGTDSGTFDYFTEVVNGEAGASRPDFTASEDDNVLVQGVAGDRGSLGYFGYAYYEENRGRLRAVDIDGGGGCVEPTPATVGDGSYAPLSRPVYLYVSRRSLDRPAVREFLRFYMQEAAALVREVGYVAVEESRYRENERLVSGGADAGSD